MSQPPQDLFEKIADLTELYLRSEISAEQLAELESLVRENKDAADAMRTVLKQAGAMRVVFAEQQQFAARIGEANQDEYLALLQTLSPAKEPEAVTLIDLDAVQHGDPGKLCKHEFAEAGRYLFEQAMERKRAIYTAGSAVAAVLLFAVTLFFVFSGGQDDPVIDPLANTPLWDTPTQTHRPVVATLTDSVGAQWHSGDKPVPMPMGAQLVAYERLTLTQGFAEITTRRGATALLQAPCTIELTDSDNAIRLHSGKLVGRCETASSKGFMVHTPSMDVVDLGTVFGVSVQADEVMATVFAGHIELELAGVDEPPRQLQANETATLSTGEDGAELVVRQQLAEGFVRRKPLVTSAWSNDSRFDVRVVHGGFAEGELLHTDADHQYISMDGRGLPPVLLGGDLIQVPNGAMPGRTVNTKSFKVRAHFDEPADVYLVWNYDDLSPPSWITRDYLRTPLQVGFLSTKKSQVPLSVWKRKQPAYGEVLLAEEMTGYSSYGLIAVPAETPGPPTTR